MKKTAFSAVAILMLTSCAPLPELKYPNGKNRVPVNGNRAAPPKALASNNAGQRIKINQQEILDVKGRVSVESPAKDAIGVTGKPGSGPEPEKTLAAGKANSSKLAAAIAAATEYAFRSAEEASSATKSAKTNPGLESRKYAVFFNFGSRVLTPTGEVAVAALAIDARNSEAIEIVGRADNIGQFKHNEILAKARAESVRKALLSHGVKIKHLVVRSEVADVDVSPDVKLKGHMPANVAERSRRADVLMALRSANEPKEISENSKAPALANMVASN